MTAPLPRVLLEPPRVATAAVVRYLTSSDGERADAFDRLVGYCYKWTKARRNKQTGAMERQYFLRDQHGSMKVEDVPQYSNVDGKRTGYSIRKEGTKEAATTAWIQEWLLGFLAPYVGKPEVEIIAAANAGEFRYLGRQCRLDLTDAVRAETDAKRERPPHVSLDKPVAEDGTTLQDYIGTDRQDAPSSLVTGTGFEEFLACTTNVVRAVVANEEELVRLDLLDALLAILGNADKLELMPARQFDGVVTQDIARLRRVSLTSARAYKRRFYESMARELGAGNPAVRAVFLELPDQRSMGGRAVPGHQEDTDSMPPVATETFYGDHGCAWNGQAA
jgi:hypothetical protein